MDHMNKNEIRRFALLNSERVTFDVLHTSRKWNMAEHF